MSRWLLYLDESGNFDEAAGTPRPDSIAVGGVLLRIDVPHFDAARIVGGLTEAAPEIPWPWHASQIQLPAAHLLWHYRSARPGSCTPLITREIKHLERVAGPTLQLAIAALDQGKEPKHDALRTLGHSMTARGRAECDRLRDHAIDSFHRVVARSMVGGHFCVVGAVDLDRDVRATSSAETYLLQLGRALRRALDVVALTPGVHDVDVEVLSRGLLAEGLDGLDPETVKKSNHGWPKTQPRHIGVAASRGGIDGNRRSVPGAGAARIARPSIAEFDASSIAEHVLADFIAYNVRVIARRRPQTWAEFDQAVFSAIGIRPHLVAPGIAAGPPVETELEDHQSGRARFEKTQVGWGWDQAADWARYWP